MPPPLRSAKKSGARCSLISPSASITSTAFDGSRAGFEAAQMTMMKNKIKNPITSARRFPQVIAVPLEPSCVILAVVILS